MAYIYKVANIVNNKVYIGKTQRSIEHRWQEHLRDATKRCILNRPLYKAINKYGKDKFYVELVETCNDKDASNREQYWIQRYKSYKHGYNATRGGDGKPYINRDQILKLWKSGHSKADIIKLTKHDQGSIKQVLYDAGISTTEIRSRYLAGIHRCPVNMYTIDGEPMCTFDSISDAARALGIHIQKSHIRDVCKGKRKSAHGYTWKYAIQS